MEYGRRWNTSSSTARRVLMQNPTCQNIKTMEYRPRCGSSGECFACMSNPEFGGNQRKLSFVNLLDHPSFPEVPSFESVSQNADSQFTQALSQESLATSCPLDLDQLAPQPPLQPEQFALKRSRRQKVSRYSRKRVARARHRHKGRFISKAEAEALQASCLEGNSPN